MDYLIDYNQIEPKLKLLVDNHDLILNEYSSNKDKLIFKDFTSEQKQSISSIHSGYTINLDTYAAANRRNIEKYGWHVAALFADGKNFIKNIVLNNEPFPYFIKNNVIDNKLLYKIQKEILSIPENQFDILDNVFENKTIIRNKFNYPPLCSKLMEFFTSDTFITDLSNIFNIKLINLFDW